MSEQGQNTFICPFCHTKQTCMVDEVPDECCDEMKENNNEILNIDDDDLIEEEI